MRAMSLANRNIKEVYRDPITVILGIAMPIGLLLLFTTIGKGAAFPPPMLTTSVGARAPLPIFSPGMLAPGIAVFSLAFLVMFCAILLSKDRQSALLSRLLASPLTGADFIIAYTLPFLPIALAQIGASFLTGYVLGMRPDAGALLSLAVLLPMALTCVCLGIILGSLFDENQISAIGSITITAVGLFGGAWMDLETVGGIFKTVGSGLPFSHAVNAARALSAGEGFETVLGDFAWVTAYAVVSALAATFAFRWRTKP